MVRHSFKRSDRLGHQLQKEIGTVLQLEVADPRLQFVTVTGVRLTEDLKQATVYLSILDEDKKKVLDILRHAGSYVRTCVGRRCYLKYVPRLVFRLDETLEKATRIDRILQNIHLEENDNINSIAEEPGQEE